MVIRFINTPPWLGRNVTLFVDEHKHPVRIIPGVGIEIPAEVCHEAPLDITPGGEDGGGEPCRFVTIPWNDIKGIAHQEPLEVAGATPAPARRTPK